MSVFRIRRFIVLLPCAMLIILTSIMSAHARETNLSDRNEAVVRQAFERWAEGGNVFADLLAPDVKWTIHGSGPVAGTYVGLENFVEQAAAPLTSRLASPLIPVLHAIWAVGDTVVVRFDGSARTTSGGTYANQFVWIFQMSEGVVAEAEAFLDLAAYQEVVENNVPRTD